MMNVSVCLKKIRNPCSEEFYPKVVKIFGLCLQSADALFLGRGFFLRERLESRLCRSVAKAEEWSGSGSSESAVPTVRRNTPGFAICCLSEKKSATIFV